MLLSGLTAEELEKAEVSVKCRQKEGEGAGLESYGSVGLKAVELGQRLEECVEGTVVREFPVLEVRVGE